MKLHLFVAICILLIPTSVLSAEYSVDPTENYNSYRESTTEVFIDLVKKFGKFAKHASVLKACDKKSLASAIAPTADEIRDFIGNWLLDKSKSNPLPLENKEFFQSMLLTDLMWYGYKFGFSDGSKLLIIKDPELCDYMTKKSDEIIKEKQKISAEVSAKAKTWN